MCLRITALIARRKEEWRKEAADLLPSVFSQTNIGILIGEVEENLPKDRMEHAWAFLRASMPS